MRTGITGLFLSILFAACNGPDKPAGAFLADTKPAPCKASNRISTITKEDVYDLSGYAHISRVSPFNLFDEAAVSDPKDRLGTEFPKTSPHPTKGINLYFKDGGSRIVVDLRALHKVSEIYLYDRSHTTDSVWVYSGTMQNWKLKAAFTAKGNPGSWGWRRFEISDSTQYLMFRFSSPGAEITEAAVYGCPLAALEPLPPAEYTGPRLEPKMMKEFLGVNCYQGTDIRWMKPFYYSRMYTSISRIDVDTVDNWPNIKYYITPNGWWNNGSGDYVMYADSITRDVGNKIWYAYLGVPKWMELKGMWNEDRPVTKIGMNPEDPMSYARHANMMWTMAACYGTTKVDTNLIQSIEPHRFSGRNLMTIYENGNETDAAWGGNKYCNPVSYFAQSTADYDGHEGRMGKTFGIKNADTNSNLMLAGFTSFDVDRLRVLQFLCKTMRKDKKFLWNGGIQYHYYSSNGKGDHPTDVFTSATAGITPEEDSLRQKMVKARNETYRLQPNVECILGEYGYDKSRTSKVSAPLVPGYSQSESQGLMLLRAINLIAFSGFDRYIIYWIKDDTDENDPGLFITSGLLRQKGDFIFFPYPAWYYINSLVHHLGNYVPEKIVQEKGEVWIYKYRNKISPDSAAYFVYCPSRNGKKMQNYTLQTGGVGMASVLSFKDKLAEGVVEPLPIRGGSVTLDVGEAPRLVFVKEK
jgi:hypothetical protein